MRDGQLIDEAYKIKHLPIVIIQGRYDIVCPAKTSWELYQALGGHENSNVEYRIIKYVGFFVFGMLEPPLQNSTNSIDSDCGHSAHEQAIELALVDAANKFRDLKL
jgi:proline iminopeptidase